MRFIFSLFLFTTTFLFADCQNFMNEREEEKQESSVTKYTAPTLVKDGTLSPTLLQLLSLCDISCEESIEDVVQKTQKFWYQGGKERWELEQRYADKNDEIRPLLQKLGVLSAVHSPIQEYDYALVYGALASRVRTRISYLIQEWNRGVRFNKIVILTGDRPLQTELEGEKMLLTETASFPFNKNWSFDGVLPKNEAEMMKLIFSQANLPDEMRQLPVQWVFAPQKSRMGKWVRPGTAETLQEWLQTSPEPGSCLAISNQPYVGYQHSIATKILPNTFSVVTVGQAADHLTSIAVHLDNLARWLHTETGSNK